MKRVFIELLYKVLCDWFYNLQFYLCCDHFTLPYKVTFFLLLVAYIFICMLSTVNPLPLPIYIIYLMIQYSCLSLLESNQYIWYQIKEKETFFEVLFRISLTDTTFSTHIYTELFQFRTIFAFDYESSKWFFWLEYQIINSHSPGVTALVRVFSS